MGQWMIEITLVDGWQLHWMWNKRRANQSLDLEFFDNTQMGSMHLKYRDWRLSSLPIKTDGLDS